MYTLVEVNYKHGEYNFSSFETKKKMVDSILNTFECNVYRSTEELKVSIERWKAGELRSKRLFEKIVCMGNEVIYNQEGYGIVAILKGDVKIIS